MKNRLIFVKYMTGLSEMKNRQVSELMLELYWNSLLPYTDKQCIPAFNRAVSECKFFPQPSEIIEFIQSESGLIADKSMHAWSALFHAVRSIGNYESVKFSDPVIHSCVEMMGGWIELCTMSNDEIKWKRIEFEKLYSTLQTKKNHTSHLAGVIEQDCILKNYKVKAPYLVDCNNLLISGEQLKQIESGEHCE